MTKKQDAAESIRVMKSAKCPSVSRKSTLGYDVGLSPDGEVHFRVTSNSAPGAFARCWIAWKEIRKAIEGSAREKAITSAHLARLCGGGQNTSGFVLAVLKHEGLLKASTSKKRCHELVDDSQFLASVRTLDQSGRGPSTSAGATARRKAGTKRTKAVKCDLSPSLENNPAGVSVAIPSFVAKDDPPGKLKTRPTTDAQKESRKASKAGTTKATKRGP